MKLHKLIALTVVLLLPTQGLLADNIKTLSQYNVTGPVKKVPTKTTAPIRKMKIARPKPRGPNLTVSVRYEHDVCAIDESPLGENIYNARCDLIITVKNSGDAATTSENGAFSIDLWYFDYKGKLQEGFRLIHNLGVNEKKVIVYKRHNLKSFKKSTPFTVNVDKQRLITETNENDNRAVFWLGQ